jgi:Zn-dependent proteases
MVLPLLPDTASALAFALVEMTGTLSVWFALLNLLPVPSLTGSHLLMIAMPQRGNWIAKLQPFVAVLLAVRCRHRMGHRPARAGLSRARRSDPGRIDSRTVSSAPRPLGARAEIAGDDPRDLAVASKLLQPVGDRSLEREIALPQAERDGIARELRRHPGDRPTVAGGKLSGEQPFRDADVEPAIAQACHEFRDIRRDGQLRVPGAEIARERQSIEPRDTGQDADAPTLEIGGQRRDRTSAQPV